MKREPNTTTQTARSTTGQGPPHPLGHLADVFPPRRHQYRAAGHLN